MKVTCDWHARVATLACQSYVYRHETRAVTPRPRHDHRHRLVNDPRPTCDDWRPTCDLCMAVPSSHKWWRARSDWLATNLWLYPQFSRICSRVGPRPYKYGREQWEVICLKPPWDLWSWSWHHIVAAWAVRSHLSEASLGPVILCRSYVTPMSILCH